MRAAVCAIVAAAAVAQGLSGFGFSLVSIPLLALVVPVKAAIVGGAVLGIVQSGWSWPGTTGTWSGAAPAS